MSRCRSIHRVSPAYTLLEVVLALSLTIVVMSAIGMAIFLHLRAVDHTRVAIERDQLARTLMRRIGDDIRATVRREPFDDAGLQALLDSAKNAASALAGGGASGGNSSGSPNSGATRGVGTTGTTGTTRSAGTARALSGDDAASEEDPAAAGAPAAIAGLYGTAMELQIDIARVPRPDEMAEAMLAGGIVPSDVKTVYYFLANAVAGTSVNGASGLMRSEMNRATALYAAENGDYEIFTQNAVPLASEVVGLQFRYYDGLEWFTEWSSQERNGLPLAIEIALVIVDPLSTDESLLSGAIIDPTVDDVDPDLVYHTVVHLPNAQLTSSGEMSESGEATSDGSTTGAGAGSSPTGSGGTMQ